MPPNPLTQWFDPIGVQIIWQHRLLAEAEDEFYVRIRKRVRLLVDSSPA